MFVTPEHKGHKLAVGQEPVELSEDLDLAQHPPGTLEKAYSREAIQGRDRISIDTYQTYFLSSRRVIWVNMRDALIGTL